MGLSMFVVRAEMARMAKTENELKCACWMIFKEDC
jgi:hypothetical protein